MTDDVRDEIRAWNESWVRAELAGDVAALERLSHPELKLVGPLGFVLDREQWLDRYRSGDLVTSELDWQEGEIRVFEDFVAVIGVQSQRAAHRGRPADGEYRVTQVLVPGDDGWLLVSAQLSPITRPG